MGILENLFGYVMRGLFWLTHNYIISLLLFALVFQLLLFPLGWKQQKNMVKQATLRPKEMAIKKKYAGRNDQATMRKMQNEIMALYQKEGYSQFAGCLPMIIQMIIIFPLYWVVIRPLQYCGGLSANTCYALAKELGFELNSKGQPTASAYQVDIARQLSSGWRPDASVVDADNVNVLTEVEELIEKFGDAPSATLFGFDLGVTPFNALGTVAWWLILIPILNLGLTYLSQFISKKLSYQSPQAEAAQMGSMRIMMLVLPLMTFFVTATFATAIGIYWIFRTMLSIAQQFILHKALPYPTFTEEDYKRAEKEYKKGITTSSQASNYDPQKPYRSLHHIDDDE